MSAGLFKGGGGGRKPNLEWSKKGVLRAGGGIASTDVDVLIRLNTGTSGQKYPVADWNANTIGLANGTWSNVGAAVYPEWDDAFDLVVPGLSVGGVGAGDATPGNVGIQLSPAPVANYGLFTFGTSKANLGLAFAIRMAQTTDQFGIYNVMRLDTSGGNFFMASCEIDGNPTPDVWSINAHAGGADGTPITGLAMEKWYWVTMVRNATTAGVLKIYDPDSAYALVGTSTATLGGSDAVTAVRCGITDTTGQSAPAGKLILDDIAIKFTATHILPT